MDVNVLVALAAGICVGAIPGLTAFRLYRTCQQAYHAATQRADMAEDRERSNFNILVKCLEQNSSLAQQLATLRVETGAVPEERNFEVDVPWEPWSEELEDFLSKIENPDALEAMEEEAEAMRAAGKSDTEILARFRRGD